MRRLLLVFAVCFLATGCTDDISGISKDLGALSSALPVKPVVPPVAGKPCPSTGFGGVKPWVAQVAHHIQIRFGVTVVYGVTGGSVASSDHPRGYATDFMVYTDKAKGDAIAADALANWSRYGVKYVIWRQRINEGDGWSLMEDRGSPTANHMDHVHISFTDAPGAGPVTC